MTAGLVERLAQLDSCAVSDACDSLGLPPAVTGLGALTAGTRIAGRAVTAKLCAGQPDGAPVRHPCTAAVEAARAGEILVIEQPAGIDAAGWGGVLSKAAQVKGVAGVVVDGMVRDIDEAAWLGFPIYARGVTARAAHGRLFAAGFNVPVSLGEAAVYPGDLVLADSSGVVVLPAAQAGRIVAEAEYFFEKERRMAGAVHRGEPVSTVMDADYERLPDRKTW